MSDQFGEWAERISALAEFAAVLAGYRDALEANGFTRDEAIRLTGEFAMAQLTAGQSE